MHGPQNIKVLCLHYMQYPYDLVRRRRTGMNVHFERCSTIHIDAIRIHVAITPQFCTSAVYIMAEIKRTLI